MLARNAQVADRNVAEIVPCRRRSLTRSPFAPAASSTQLSLRMTNSGGLSRLALLTMQHSADAVVVGAGVIGASIALELARDGLRVLVVDRASGPGQGSTSASSAIVRFNYSTFDGVATAWESKHCWERWSAHLGLQ